MSMEAYTDEQVKVSTDFKTTIPKQTRNHLGVGIGEKVSFRILADGTVKVEKAQE